jgi:2-hydroxy-3-keto-5-methylthiopentenyl-1-phosphate phosphatase
MSESEPKNEKESELFTLLMDYRDGEIGVKPIFREIEQQISKSEDAILDKLLKKIALDKGFGGKEFLDLSLLNKFIENLKSKQ